MAQQAEIHETFLPLSKNTFNAALVGILRGFRKERKRAATGLQAAPAKKEGDVPRRRRPMFKVRVLAAIGGALVAALAVATIATGRVADDGSPSPEAVVGGGRFGPGCFEPSNPPLCFSTPRDFSVGARATGNGHALGVWFYGNNDTGSSFTGRVMCMRRLGNTAVVGGVVTEASNPANVGFGFTQYYVDNGPVGGAVRDSASAAFVDSLESPSWPRGFPRVCPSSTTSPAGYMAVHSGDVAVAADEDSGS
jgi:hypothetical protein